MPYSNKRRDPLSSLSPNSAGKANPTDKPNSPVVRQLYKPLGICVDHIAQPLLPWEDCESEVTGLQVFELFWDSKVINVLVEGANLYAKEKGAVERSGEGAAASGECHLWDWPWNLKKVTESDIKVFLGLLLYMGARQECGSSRFWKGEGEREVFRVMSLECFSQIKRYLHISDAKMQLSCSEWFRMLEPLALNSMLLRTQYPKFYFAALNV